MDSPSIAEQAGRPTISTRRLLATAQQPVSEARRRFPCNIDGKTQRHMRAAGGEGRVALGTRVIFIKGSVYDGDRS